MKITKQWLIKNNACQESLEAWEKEKDHDVFATFDRLIKSEKYNWINWSIIKLFTHQQCIQYSIFAAEQVIDNFEKQYPEDKSPREAIEAAKNVLKKNNKKNRSAAWSAAESAARSAAWSAAESAESAAWSVAWSAAWSARSAAESAARLAAWSAAESAESAWSVAWSVAWSAAESAEKKIKLKIIKYGIKLLKENIK